MTDRCREIIFIFLKLWTLQAGPVTVSSDPSRGYIMRGGREMENHFECLWDLFHSIPSLEIPGASVLMNFIG